MRDRTHWNMQNVRPRDPVTLGLCTLKDLNDAVDRARRKAAREDARQEEGGKACGRASRCRGSRLMPDAAGAEAVDPAEADQPDLGETSAPLNAGAHADASGEPAAATARVASDRQHHLADMVGALELGVRRRCVRSGKVL